MRLTAKSVLLELLSATVPRPAPARSLVAASALFGISENSTRVTLARLLARGTLEATSRGTYKLGAATEGLTSQVTGWRSVEAQAVRWGGGWICAFTGALPRSDRRRLRARTRALGLSGFRELERGLEVRPDNLAGGAAAAARRLHAAGLDAEALVFHAVLPPAVAQRARKLWDARALLRSYRAGRERLERWLAQEPRRDRDAAAREVFLLGRAAVREILFDPLLPDEWVDVDQRRAFIDAMRRFDEAGRRIWVERFGADRALVRPAELAMVGRRAAAERARSPGAVH